MRVLGESMLYAAWFLALGGMAISLQALCGYFWAVEHWQRWGPVGTVPMAPNTAVMGLAATSAIMVALAGLKIRFGIGYSPPT